ncbi:hypothetical protein TBLA_0C03980 [Henningerozyma blattae CBS 6284]|uniref:GOLD domain-containing protein n=1 Tax=Henningerozyma blattae (strain ATCC 34711 / CBS 6284 / DSM 70876 / NBRC 10599 / NRRL Y-10934 / UCD 77-7) TaxID=1071380 RepID=I2H1E6_HENB6|nr:hypothetical protein TBLA_0C03980 [Tetrapisispora blattae CBS 6284]CCH60198.1 hypothetical protein TBLA_0C03980 [Tetrapisispora blattae CBS 6284]
MLYSTFLQVFLVILLIPSRVSAFYFYTNGGERKCFHKELPLDALLQAKYKVQVYDEELQSYRDTSNEDLGLVIDVEEVFDNYHRVSHQKSSPAGEFTFIALDSGEHRICFQPQANGWLAKVKAKVDVTFQISSDKKLDSKRRGEINALHQKVNYLIAKVGDIKREHAMVRERESTFRDASEAVNSRAQWWIVIQILVLIGICAWQMKHLRSFFVKQKVL